MSATGAEKYAAALASPAAGGRPGSLAIAGGASGSSTLPSSLASSGGDQSDLATAQDAQTAILAATIDAWSGRIQVAKGLGALDPESWTKSIGFMTDLKLVPKAITVNDVLQTGLLPAGG